MSLADQPDKAMGVTELAAQLTETSVDVMRIDLQRQQLDATQKKHRARQLRTEYQHTLLTMEADLNLQAMRELTFKQSLSWFMSKHKLARATILDGVT
eukprot:2420488-Amphidinium_carterae.2